MNGYKLYLEMKDNFKLVLFTNKEIISNAIIKSHGEFDPTPGWTLAACLTHISQADDINMRMYIYIYILRVWKQRLAQKTQTKNRMNKKKNLSDEAWQILSLK